MCPRKVRVVNDNHYFPPLFKNIGIYCRVSSSVTEQLRSMSSQASGFVQMVSQRRDWSLVDIYLDFKSGESTKNRPEFQRMMDDARAGKLDLILTKSISRFGRNVTDTITAIRELKHLNVTVVFDEEGLNSNDSDTEFITTVLAAFAENENQNRRENQNWAINKRAEDGTSKIYSRPCYGYKTDDNGELVIDYLKAAVVQDIFRMYLSGMSILKIKSELEQDKILSPSGKNSWCKRTIDTILSNEKYIGQATIFKTYSIYTPEHKRAINKGEHSKYVMNDSNPSIITDEVFNAVQAEKERRSNITVDENGTHRKSTRFSSLKESD